MESGYVIGGVKLSIPLIAGGVSIRIFYVSDLILLNFKMCGKRPAKKEESL